MYKVPVGLYNGGMDWRERFWSKIGPQRDDGCREWTAGKFRYGYGAFLLDGKLRKAHRVMWELHFGPIPEGLFVCHHCDNPPCVEVSHLFLGTPLDNMRDKIAKGRLVASPGERNGMWGVRRTHCKRGHPLVEENIYLHGKDRHCRTCRQERIAVWNAKVSAERRERRASLQEACGSGTTA